MAKGHWARYPVRKDGSRKPGYRWVRESRRKVAGQSVDVSMMGVAERESGHESKERQDG